MRQLLVEMNKAKAKKAANIEEIRSELRSTMSGSHRHLFDDGDDDDEKNEEEDDDVYMYPADMNPDKRADIGQYVVHSKLVNGIANKKKGL